MAIWWVGPAIMSYGTDEQKQRFIPKILTAEEIWATGYSEPSSGSDMAAAKTRAERDGDYYVVNGQKIWTTLAHISDWYFVLVRTSTEGPKWGGLSLLLMDMRSPGVEIRPDPPDRRRRRVQRGLHDRREVPVANLLGEEGQGWEVVSSALVNERSGIAGSIRFDQALEWLIDHGARAQGKTRRSRPCASASPTSPSRAAIMRYAGLRSLSDSLHGAPEPAPLGGDEADGARAWCRSSRRRRWRSSARTRTLMGDEHAPSSGRWARQYLYDRSMTIAGGTSEVQRNIVAQRILGLPRDRGGRGATGAGLATRRRRLTSAGTRRGYGRGPGSTTRPRTKSPPASLLW